MLNKLLKKLRLPQTRISFGATSAIITNLSIISALNTLTQPTLSIITGILVVAIADNVSDSFGIHMYQESDCKSEKEVWISTLTNFFARILVSLVFVLLVIYLPIRLAVVASIIWGLIVLIVLSYIISRVRQMNAYLVILEHISIAAIVIIASHFIGKWLIDLF